MKINKFNLVLLACLSVVDSAAQSQSLETIAAEVIRQHPRVRAAAAGALGIASEIEVARAALRPKLNVSGATGRGFSFASGGLAPAGDVLLQGVLPLYDGQRSQNEISRQGFRFENAQYKADQARDQLLALTSDTYIEVLKQEALIKISQSNLAALEQLMAKISEIVRLDRGRAVDASQVAVRLQQAKVNLSARQNALMEARAVLGDLVGRGNVMPVDVADPRPGLPSNLEQAAQWLDEHPSIKAALADAKVAERSADIAAAWSKPRLDLQGTLSNPNSFANSRYFSNFDVRMAVQWPAFDGGAGKASALAAAQQKLAAEEQVRAAHKDLSSELTKTFSQVQSREGRYAAYLDLTLRARTVRDAYWEQFTIGRRSILDLLNAENEGFQAMLSAEQEKQELLQLQYRLLSASGRLAQWLKLDEPVVSSSLSGEAN